MDIASLREKIDELDARLVELLNERARCAHQIGEIKRDARLPVYEPEREKIILTNVRRMNRGPLPNGDLVQLYERIIDVMRKIQREEIKPATPPPHVPETDPND